MAQRKPQRFSTHVGAVVGDWRILADAPPNRHGAPRMLCRCQRCGTEKLVIRRHLMNGDSRGCGCYRRQLMIESRMKHGHAPRDARSITLKSYKNLVRLYGERVCVQWRQDFRQFVADVGERPNAAWHLKVIDTSQPILPFNVRWEIRRRTTIPKNVARAQRRVAEGEARRASTG